MQNFVSSIRIKYQISSIRYGMQEAKSWWKNIFKTWQIFQIYNLKMTKTLNMQHNLWRPKSILVKNKYV